MLNRRVLFATIAVFGLIYTTGSCFENILEANPMANTTQAILQSIKEADVVEKTRDIVRDLNTTDSRRRAQQLRDTFEPVLEQVFQTDTVFDGLMTPLLNAVNSTAGRSASNSTARRSTSNSTASKANKTKRH